MRGRRKSFPQPPAGVDRQLKIYLAAMQEMIETGEGARGDPLDTKLTFRDLIDSGIAKLRGAVGAGGISGSDLITTEVQDRITPPAPNDLSIVAVFGAVTISWQSPYSLYANHAYAEIWRASGKDAQFDSAQLIGTANGSIYSDYAIEEGEWYTYWIRLVSLSDVSGAWHSPTGTSIETSVSVEFMLEELSGKIDESVLASALRGEIDKINELGKLYTLTLDVNGYVSGFGAYNDGITSDFAITADRFWIAPPNSTNKVKPFIVQGGGVYMDTAFIRDASIQEGKLGAISFGKIRSQSGQPITTVSGLLRAEYIDVGNLRVTNANIDGDIYSSNYIAGSRGWRIFRNGSAEFNDASIRGTLYANDIRGDVNIVQQIRSSATRWASPGSWRELDRVTVSFSGNSDGYKPFFMITSQLDSRDNTSSGAGTKTSGIRARVQIRRNGAVLTEVESGCLANGLAGGIALAGGVDSKQTGSIEFVLYGYSHESYANFFDISGVVGGYA